MSLKIINTSDGSHTIYNSELNETYHSIHGSINESMHVYIEEGLNYFQKKASKKMYKILWYTFNPFIFMHILLVFLKWSKIKIVTKFLS